MVKARKTNYVNFGIDCWSQVNGWDNVQAKINLMSDDDWGLVFYNPYFNEVFINAPLKKGKCYMLNQEVENMGVFHIRGPVDAPYIGVALSIGLFERAKAGMKVGYGGVR